MHPTTHTRLTIVCIILSALLGIGAYADLLPPQYAGVVAILTGILAHSREALVRAGDILDDGKANGSFQPEADAKGQGPRAEDWPDSWPESPIKTVVLEMRGMPAEGVQIDGQGLPPARHARSNSEPRTENREPRTTA